MSNPHSQIIISAKDYATATFNRIGLGIQGMYNKVFSLQNALAGSVIYGFKQFVGGSVEATDSIGKTADKVGLLTDELQELRYAASLANVNQAQLDMGMQRFSRRLGEVAQGTGELKAISEQYGVQLFDNNGRMRSNMDLLNDWADVIKGASSEQEALRIAFKLFDSEGAALVNMLRGGSTALTEVRQEAHDFGIVIDEALVRESAKANDAMTRLDFVLSSQLKGTLVELAPDIVEVSDSIADWVRENREFLTQDVPGHIRKTADSIGEVIDRMSEAKDGWDALPEDMRNTLFGIGVAKWLGIPVGVAAGVEGLGLVIGKLKEWQDLEEDGVGWHTSVIVRNFFDSIGLGASEDVKRVVEQLKELNAQRAKAYQAAAEYDALDPRNKDLGSGTIYAPDASVVPVVKELTEQQKRLQEQLATDIKRLTLDQFAFARYQAEQTYKKDLELAGKSEELVAQASERRRLSLASVAEEERKAGEKKVEDAKDFENELHREVERATLDEYAFRRREAERYYADLKARAHKAGVDTGFIDQALAQKITEINQQQAEARTRQYERMEEEAKRANMTMLASSESMVDGIELGQLRLEDRFTSTADTIADAYVDAFDMIGDMGADMIFGMKDGLSSLSSFIEQVSRQMFKAMFMTPITSAASGFLSDSFGSLFGSSGSTQHIDMNQSGTPLGSYADGGISYGPQLAWVSEGRYATEAHVPLPDGSTIPVTISGGGGGGQTINFHISNMVQVDGDVSEKNLALIQAAMKTTSAETVDRVIDKLHREPTTRQYALGGRS